MDAFGQYVEGNGLSMIGGGGVGSLDTFDNEGGLGIRDRV